MGTTFSDALLLSLVYREATLRLVCASGAAAIASGSMALSNVADAIRDGSVALGVCAGMWVALAVLHAVLGVRAVSDYRAAARCVAGLTPKAGEGPR
jgi:hypothetical protein